MISTESLQPYRGDSVTTGASLSRQFEANQSTLSTNRPSYATRKLSFDELPINTKQHDAVLSLMTDSRNNRPNLRWLKFHRVAVIVRPLLSFSKGIM